MASNICSMVIELKGSTIVLNDTYFYIPIRFKNVSLKKFYLA